MKTAFFRFLVAASLCLTASLFFTAFIPTAIASNAGEDWLRKTGIQSSVMGPAEKFQRAGKLSGSDGVWRELPPPPSRAVHTAIYDPARTRMVVFGGTADDGSAYFNDVWTLSLWGTPRWTLLTPSGTSPTVRAGHSAIYDPVRDRMVVFGGYANSALNDVWALSLGANPEWTLLTPSGMPPTVRAGHSAIYDPVRDRMVMFGGDDGSYLNDVWALSLGANPEWTLLTPSGTPPSARTYHTAIYDPTDNRMVVFGGQDGDGSNLNDVWALSLGASPEWTLLTPSGTPLSARTYHTAIYDPTDNRMVVFGGWDEAGMRNDVWALSLGASPEWTLLTPSGTLPSERECHTAIYCPVGDRMIVFGGYDGSFRYDVWALSLGASPEWTELALSEGWPNERDGHTAIYDPARDRMVVFGGRSYNPLYRNEVWSLSFGGTPEWTLLIPSGTPPSARTYHTAIYDPVGDRMVVFGGNDWAGARNDVWTLSLGASPEWTLLTPSGTPPSARTYHTAIYDPVGDRMVVFGGNDWAGARNDVWTLSLGASPEWTLLTPSGTPPSARTHHKAIYDPTDNRMVIFGGSDGSFGLNDVWALSLGASPEWTLLTPSGTPPSARTYHTAIYDPTDNRMVVFGGWDEAGMRNDVWALSLGASPEWTLLTPSGTPPIGRFSHTAIYDPVRDQMVVFGGYSLFSTNDVWGLQWATATGVMPPTETPSLTNALNPCYPNPFNPEVTIPFELRQDERVTLTIYDIRGSLIRTVFDGELPRGMHRKAWNGKNEKGEQVSSGVYFCRLRVGEFSATQKILMLK